MKLPNVALLGLGLVFAACGYRENGASCWSDEQCASDNCGWGGSCEPSVLDLIASWLESDRPSPESPSLPASAPPPGGYTPPPSCVGFDEEQCRAAPHCSWYAICFDGPGSSEYPDAGVFSCMQEYQTTLTCPGGCTLWSSCI